MHSLGVLLEYAALVSLCVVVMGALFFFLVEWFATSATQSSEARVFEVVRQRPVAEETDKAA